MSLIEHRRYRLAVLEKMAAPVDIAGGRQFERVKKRELGEAGEFLQQAPSEMTSEEKEEAVSLYRQQVSELKPAEYLAKEVRSTYKDFFRSKGLNPDKDPETYTPAELSKAEEVYKEIHRFLTIGFVPGETENERHVVDPYDSRNSVINKYFGYFHKPTGEWFFTQNTLIMFYLAFYARAVGLGKYQDPGRMFKMPKNHPYFEKYPQAKIQTTFIPLKEDIEKRINANFNEIADFLERHSWETLAKEGYFLLRPLEPGERLRSPYTFDFIPDKKNEEGGIFAIKTPVAQARVSARMSPEREIMKTQQTRIVRDIIQSPEKYPGVQRAVSLLSNEYATTLKKEILNRRKELNFLGSDPAARQMVAEIIVNSLVENIKKELQEFISKDLEAEKEKF